MIPLESTGQCCFPPAQYDAMRTRGNWQPDLKGLQVVDRVKLVDTSAPRLATVRPRVVMSLLLFSELKTDCAQSWQGMATDKRRVELMQCHIMIIPLSSRTQTHRLQKIKPHGFSVLSKVPFFGVKRSR